MEIADGFSRFDSIKRNAYWHHIHLDTRFRVSADDVSDTLDHLDDCINHPTTGLIARRQALKDKLNYPEFYKRNQIEMFKLPKVAQKNDSFEKKFNELYPKTGSLRKNLIDKQRITFSYLSKPKMSFLQKISLKLLSKI